MESECGAHWGSVLTLQAALLFVDVSCSSLTGRNKMEHALKSAPLFFRLKNGEVKVRFFGAICLHFKRKKTTCFHVCVIRF